MEAQALRSKGWSITAIATHLGHDRKTIRAYLNGERRPGERKPARPEALEEFVGYCRQRLADDPHLWSTTLFDEVVELGYEGSYQALTAGVRRHELRPRCAACAAAKTRDRSVIDHPAGEETQWDWLELPNPPARWGFGDMAHLLLGVLPHSSRWRGWIAEAEDQPHLIEGLHQVATRLGGLSGHWRFDRMATVCHPGSGRITASFGPVALHYQVGIAICPSRRAWRKGAVEKSAHTIAQRWWRTLADDVTVAQAQAGLDRICGKLDARGRMRDGVRSSVGELADAEPLRAMPAPFPAVIEVERTVGNQAQISFRGNRYSVVPGHAGEIVTVRHKLGTTTLEVADRHGGLLAHHLRAPDGAGAVIRSDEHAAALTKVVLANFSDREPCRRKTRRPPSDAALAQADRIRAGRAGGDDGEQVVIDFAGYVGQTRPFGVEHTGGGHVGGGHTGGGAGQR
ncbi:MAG TPA: IS21 family transposase [Umezawaea sp.]|nr:IS21 family transposase [Candidatus Limnocylindria bacterium]HWO61340.1 IS21 family transposase [Umezawaea sp.]